MREAITIPPTVSTVWLFAVLGIVFVFETIMAITYDLPKHQNQTTEETKSEVTQ